MSNKRVLIVGGVAGGASCAARLRRMDENAEIFVFERTGDVSFANCGLPYYVGGAIDDRRQPVGGHARAVPRFLQSRDSHAARSAPHRPPESDHRGAKPSDRGRSVSSGTTPWCLSPGAVPLRPPLPGIDLPGIFTVRNMDDIDQIHAVDRPSPGRIARSWSGPATSAWKWSKT